jgi:pimeloyl-ACP methyl ester carboxylesterase
MSVQPFQIKVPQAVLQGLKKRLARTRWPDEVVGAGWDYGTNLEYLKALVDYWQNQFDWRAQEAKLNQFAQFRAEIDGLNIHFIHERGKGPKPMPIIITHGWPGSFFEICKLIPLLTDPASYGGDPIDSFDVIVPSLPGYGFSDCPRERGMMSSRHAAELWVKLMTDVLGYRRFAAAGGDIGSIITQHIAADHPELLIGIHLTYIGYYASTPDLSELSEAEKRYLGSLQQWIMREGGYFMIQGTKPQTLSYGLTDSPAGLAAWIAEKFHSWTDSDGVIERRVTKDDLLTNIMIYWVTETIGSSIRSYIDNPPQKLEPIPAVPAAFAAFPKDINPPPREWVERRLNLKQWTQMPRGGHFAAMEEPELLAEDMRKFFRNYRQPYR